MMIDTIHYPINLSFWSFSDHLCVAGIQMISFSQFFFRIYEFLEENEIPFHFTSFCNSVERTMEKHFFFFSNPDFKRFSHNDTTINPIGKQFSCIYFIIHKRKKRIQKATIRGKKDPEASQALELHSKMRLYFYFCHVALKWFIENGKTLSFTFNDLAIYVLRSNNK